MEIDKQLSYPVQGVLAAGAKKRFRICPWDSTNTHIPSGSMVKVQTEVRSQSIGTFVARLYDCYQTRDALGARLPFNPSAPMRALDRNKPDNINLVDDNTDLDPVQFGALLWNEEGTVDELNSPVVKSRPTPRDAFPFPGQNDYEFVLEIENKEGIPIDYTVEIYAQIL